MLYTSNTGSNTYRSSCGNPYHYFERFKISKCIHHLQYGYCRSWGILSIFISGLSASFGDVIARGEQEVLQKAYKEFEFSYYSLIAIVYAVTLVTIMPFIRIYTTGITDINYDLPLIGILFVLNGFLYNLKTPQGMLVISAGMYRNQEANYYSRSNCRSCRSCFGTLWGITGVLVGSILSSLYRDIDLLYFIPNLTKLPVRQTALRWLEFQYALL